MKAEILRQRKEQLGLTVEEHVMREVGVSRATLFRCDGRHNDTDSRQ